MYRYVAHRVVDKGRKDRRGIDDTSAGKARPLEARWNFAWNPMYSSSSSQGSSRFPGELAFRKIVTGSSFGKIGRILKVE